MNLAQTGTPPAIVVVWTPIVVFVEPELVLHVLRLLHCVLAFGHFLDPVHHTAGLALFRSLLEVGRGLLVVVCGLLVVGRGLLVVFRCLLVLRDILDLCRRDLVLCRDLLVGFRRLLVLS